MILQPAVLALLIGSSLTCLMLLYAVCYGVLIVARWDIKSGSERQLSLERRTYLISTILSYTLAFQLLSLFLFIYTADHLHTLFSGAMCAAGTLNVNAFGYPLLILKIVNFLMAGLWLIINHADTRGYDYPLIKIKYALLIAIAPFVQEHDEVKCSEPPLQRRYDKGHAPLHHDCHLPNDFFLATAWRLKGIGSTGEGGGGGSLRPPATIVG